MTGLRDATRLTGARRLLEATTAIQQLLSGGQGSKPSSPDHRNTIDGVAERLSETAALAHRKKPDFLGKVSLRDLVRPRAAPAATNGVNVSSGASFEWKTFPGSAGSRRYRLYVPSGYNSAWAAPLLVMLHGCTQSPDDFASGTRMNEAAEGAGCLVAYPEQTSSANMQKCWNWFGEGDQHRDAGEPSIIAGLTREIMEGYAVDPARVYVAGLSAGGAMAAIMGDAYPDLYAAVGIHSGLATAAAQDMPSAFAAMRQGAQGKQRGGARVIPTIVFHGDGDHTVSPLNGNAVIAQSMAGQRMTSQTEQGGLPGKRQHTRTIHFDSAARPLLEHWVVRGAPHAWSGGSAEGSYTDPGGPDATAEMVRFFLEHPRD